MYNPDIRERTPTHRDDLLGRGSASVESVYNTEPVSDETMYRAHLRVDADVLGWYLMVDERTYYFGDDGNEILAENYAMFRPDLEGWKKIADLASAVVMRLERRKETA